jgi:hypothetical protein
MEHAHRAPLEISARDLQVHPLNQVHLLDVEGGRWLTRAEGSIATW